MKQNHLISLITLAITVTLSAQTRADYQYTDNQEQSFSPPKGLSPEQVPCFVVLGFDDNPRSGSAADGGVNWVLSMMEGKMNPTAEFPNTGTFDGAPAKVSFYNNPEGFSGYFEDGPANLIPAYRRAYEAGHEMSNHTFNHWRNWQGAKIINASESDWISQIDQADTWLTKPYPTDEELDGKAQWEINEMFMSGNYGAGIPRDSVRGFRSPYLMYNKNTFTALKERGIWYDCSIEDGMENPDEDGTTLRWPYTLNQGSESASATAHKDVNQDKDGMLDHGDVSPVDGLWQLPNSPVFIPHDSLASVYGFEPGLRDRAKSTTIDGLEDRMIGLDYNLVVRNELDRTANGLKANEYLAVLKYTLDKRLEGNRAPFMFGVHSQMYRDQWCQTYTNITGAEMRQALEDFVDYALSKQEVRVVRGIDVIHWMQDPVPLRDAVPLSQIQTEVKKGFTAQVQGNSLKLTGLPEGNMAIRIVSMNGQLIASRAAMFKGEFTMNLGESIAPGIYSVRVNSKGSVLTQKIAIR